MANESAKGVFGFKAENLTPEDAEYLSKYGSKLSPTTKRAKWINNVNEHEDHPGQALATRNHEVIKGWAEGREAKPATIPGTEHDSRLGVLRFNFPGFTDGRLKEVDWNEWFESFDERQLVFLFQEHLRNGHVSNFFKLDSPFREHD